MSDESLVLGKRGEDLAADYLARKGYKILRRNYKTKSGEVDIIAKDKETFCFVEVKTRSSKRFGLGYEAVISRKQRQLSKAALSFLKKNNFLSKSARFDVVSVDISSDRAEIDLLKNAFELNKNFIY